MVILALNQKQIDNVLFFALLFVLLVSFDDIVAVKTQFHFKGLCFQLDRERNTQLDFSCI